LKGGEQVDVRKKPQTAENGIFKGRRGIPYGIAEIGVCRGGTDAAFTLNVFDRPDQPPAASAVVERVPGPCFAVTEERKVVQSGLMGVQK